MSVFTQKTFLFLSFIVILLVVIMFFVLGQENNNNYMENNIKLPEPSTEGEVSLEEAISKRRSVRSYKEEPLNIRELSQILWASQGITNSDLRAAPSAGALYPLSIYVVAENVENLTSGIYQYLVQEHRLKPIKKGSFKDELYQSALRQSSIKESSLIVIITGDYDITEKVYGERAKRYVHMEAGHVGQNIYLQAETLGLGTVAIGAFNDEEIKETIALEKEVPLYIFPIVRK